MCNYDLASGDFEMKEVSTTSREEFKPCGVGMTNRKFKDSIDPGICTSVLFDLGDKDQKITDKKKLFIRKINCCE